MFKGGGIALRLVTACLVATVAISPTFARRIDGPRAPGSALSAVDEDQSRVAARLARQFADTWNRREGRGYGEAYWPDAELVDPSGQVWSGREAIVQTHRDLWNGPAKATHMTAQVRRVLPLSASLFVVDIDTSASGFSPPPPGASEGIVKTRLKHVVQKRNGDWKIVTSQNTFVSGR